MEQAAALVPQDAWGCARALAAAAVVLAGSACGAPPGQRDARPAIRVAHLGAFGFGDLPTLFAHERMRADGYVVESLHYAAGDLLFSALARGAADIGNGAITAAWSAAGRGAPLRTVMEHVSNPHRLVARREVRSCADLDGRRLAVHSQGGVVNALVAAFMADECPGVRAEVIHAEESSGRAAALLSGGVDAAALDLNSALWLDHQAPGRFHEVVAFAERWPEVKTLGVQVNTQFASTHPQAVADYVRARLDANRALNADPDLIAELATRFLGESERWPAVARAYVQARAWAGDGGLTGPAVDRTLAFFASGAIKASSAADVADLRYLEEARASGDR